MALLMNPNPGHFYTDTKCFCKQCKDYMYHAITTTVKDNGRERHLNDIAIVNQHRRDPK